MNRWLVLGIALASGCDKLFGLDALGDISTTVDAGPIVCPTTYDVTIPASTSTYRYVSSVLPWPDAEAACAADGPGMHLVVLDSDDERVQLIERVTPSVWIGLSDRVHEGTFEWVTGHGPMLVNGVSPWAPFQPDNLNGRQDCGRIVEATAPANAMLLDDGSCDGAGAYYCECDGFLEDPAKF